MIDLSYRDIQGDLQEKQETANSYVISKPGEYCFPLIMGNAISSGHSNILGEFYDFRGKLIKTPDLPVKPSAVKILVWDSSRDYIRNLRIRGDYVELLVPGISDLGSNYIISAHTKEGDIIWSWHIWLWKKKLQTLDCGLLDTNLGKCGDIEWLYQWGRKDPILSSNFKLSRLSGTGKSPGKFIKYSYGKYPNQFRWESWKCIYDPCPPGYKVPEPSVFNNLKKEDGLKFLGPSYISMYGRTYTTAEFCCYWTSGTLAINGTDYGYYFQVMNRENDKSQKVVHCQKDYAFPIRPQKTY